MKGNEIRVTEFPWDTAVLHIQRVGASRMAEGAMRVLITAELPLPASESSCGLHTLGGPEQIVPLPLASFRADRLISSPR